MSQSSAGDRYAQSASFLRFSHGHKEALYSDSLWQKLGGIKSTDHLVALFNADNAQDSIDKMLYTDVRTRLADHLLMVGDRMTMAHSLEGRSPYVDHHLAEFVASIPPQYKLKGRRLKNILRQVSRDYLPEPLIERPKRGFSFPLAYWFRGALRDTTARIFCDSRLVEAGYFKREAMLTMLDEHTTGQIDHNYRLWLLLNLELWFRLFVEGTSQEDLKDYLAGVMGRAELAATA
jgi:asparagine synthase (glutamine-hydrolysing)